MSNVITQWNDIMLDAIRASGMNPPMASRAMAMVQTDVFDSVNAINGSQYDSFGYSTGNNSTINASETAAVASSAYTILKILFPNQAAMLDAKYAETLASIPEGEFKTAGINLGHDVADYTISLRAGDHSNEANIAYTPLAGEEYWQPTPAGFANPLLPGWGNVDPFGLTSSSQFMPEGPDALNSAAFTQQYNEVMSLGGINSTTRTQEQTDIAKFWASGAGTFTPPGQWNEIAQNIAATQNLSVYETARMFALLSTAAADAGIAAWEIKYTYNSVRPVTAIMNGNTDSNLDTVGDTTWRPLLSTPPFPSYISGHSTFSAASAEILKLFLGTDEVNFTASSDGAGFAAGRQFTSLWAAAQEAGMSRIYGGIHFQKDNIDGLATGKNIGDYIYDTLFKEQKFLSNKSEEIHLTSNTLAISAQDGNDRVFGSQGNDTLKGDNGNDRLEGSVGDDRIYGGNGNDRLLGQEGNDKIYGEAGNDKVYGGNGDDKIFGGAGNDQLCGDKGDDQIDGGTGDDKIQGDKGNDTLTGGEGNDSIYGGEGNDVISDGAGNDNVFGGFGNDTFIFGAGNDIINLGDGEDTIILKAGFGNDTVFGFLNTSVQVNSSINGLTLTSFADILSHITVDASGAKIDFGNGDSLTFAGANIANLEAIDWNFIS